MPFHFYAPDVYQGTTHANAALLSVLPKAAGLVVLVRLVLVAMPGAEPYAWRIALALAVLTMTLGNVLALWQDNLRRLLAYSSIANAGYMLIGLAVGLASAVRRRAAGTASPPCSSTWASTRRPRWARLPPWSTSAATRQQIEAVDELAGLGRTRPAAGRPSGPVHVQPGRAAAAGRVLGQAAALRQRPGVQAGDGGSLRPWFVAWRSSACSTRRWRRSTTCGSWP